MQVMQLFPSHRAAAKKRQSKNKKKLEKINEEPDENSSYYPNIEEYSNKY
jgi:hypothetical protein